MAFDFESEFGDQEEESPTAVPTEAAGTTVDEYVNTDPEDGEPSEYMGEVDKRLEVATHYRELLKAPLFAGGGDTARIVEREIRSFVRNRLEVLLSIRAEAAPAVVAAQFSDDEAASIRQLLEGYKELSFLVSKVREKEGTTPPPRIQAAPTPQPTQKVAPQAIVRPAAAPAPREAARPGPAKPGRKPGPKAAPKLTETKLVEDPRNGAMVPITKARVQNPVGKVPFPSSSAAMSAATEGAAARGSSLLSTAAPALSGLVAAVQSAQSTRNDD